MAKVLTTSNFSIATTTVSNSSSEYLPFGIMRNTHSYQKQKNYVARKTNQLVGFPKISIFLKHCFH
ncbi:hypothetical protein SAMN04487992_1267 [Cellulophaga baltica]|uniref:Uncharacterized protein n=1 Tax=Cellulophaga baltica TaxID=76594 RepID=A0A1G7M1E9_9FLAO|nr:hypothetical protein SAMN04487992_1267 [Cellulophaga baltica]